MVIARTTLLYIGPEDEPEYVPENFVSKGELLDLIHKRIQALVPKELQDG